jgi:hypothetical protein
MDRHCQSIFASLYWQADLKTETAGFRPPLCLMDARVKPGKPGHDDLN